MGHSNTTLYAPIDVVGDLAYILGSSSSDIGTLIKQEGTINPWAKYKPFRSSAEGLVARDTFASFGFGYSDSDLDNPPQIKTGTGSSLNAFVRLAEGTDNGWVYKRPRATSTEKARLLDFAKVEKENGVAVLKTGSSNIGYNSAAPNPFGTFSMGATSYSIGDSLTGGQTLNTQIGDSGIAIKDMADTYTYGSLIMQYYGIALINQGSGASYRYFNSNRIQDGTRLAEPMTVPAITLTNDNIEAGTYKAYPFMTTSVPPANRCVKTATKTETISYNMIPVPGSTPITITVASLNFTITMTVTASAGSTSGTRNILVDVSISHNGNSDVQITNVYVKYRKSGKSYSDAQVTGEVFVQKANQTVPSAPVSVYISDFQSDMPIVDNDKVYVGFEYNGVTNYNYKNIPFVPV